MKASFGGDFDEWTCECGNTPCRSGFYPCFKDGAFSQDNDEQWDRSHYRCHDCDAIMCFDHQTNVGKIVGKAKPSPIDIFIGIELDSCCLGTARKLSEHLLAGKAKSSPMEVFAGIDLKPCCLETAHEIIKAWTAAAKTAEEDHDD